MFIEPRNSTLNTVDIQFFRQYPDRRARIRLPHKQTHIDGQRAVRYLDEQELAFRQLGPHDVRRRRIIVYRVPADHPTHANHLMQIPFLLFADETVEDDDKTLLPLIHQLMMEAAAR
jgi:hypothetical protein